MNYYNDNDPKACAWIRELISAGHIPPGDVDGRSITDVAAGDLKGYIQCHWFAGIAGWAYALRLAGWSPDRPVWTASLPCQPFSQAGKQEGHGDERHLWPHFHRLVRERNPGIIFGEQVAGAVGFGWLDGIFADLEKDSYACGACVLGAHSVGAPHIRQRLYWMADSTERGQERFSERARNRRNGFAHGGRDGRLADTRHEPEGGGTRPGEAESGRALGDFSGRGAWSLSELLPCLDGKARRVPRGIKPDIILLANGIWYRMAHVRAAFLTETIYQIKSYAEASRSNTAEIMFMVQRAAYSQTIQWALGGQGELSSEEVLLPFLRDIASALNGTSNGGGRQEARTEDDDERDMRGLRDTVESQCASYRRESEEQHGGKPSDSLLGLSWFLARCGQASGYSTRREDAATFPLAHGVKGRVGLLRGYGNAIVPQCAQAFIEAYLDTVDESR